MKKLNKKGFTLIELLAVIVILGVIMVIAVPAVTKYINQSRKDSYISTAKSFADAVSTAAATNTGTDYQLPADGKAIVVDVKKVKLNKGGQSPYTSEDFGKDTNSFAQVIVYNNGGDYEYYFVSKDSKGNAIDGRGTSAKEVDALERDDVKSNSSLEKIKAADSLTLGSNTVASGDFEVFE